MNHGFRNHFLRDVGRAQRAALQRFGLIQIGGVADEQIDIDAARKHLRVDLWGSPPESDEDDWIQAQIPAARAYCEEYLGRALAPRTVELATNEFPRHAVTNPPGPAFALRFGPVQSITSVKYIDGDAVEQTMDQAGYELDPYSTPSRLILAAGASWPTGASGRLNCVKVRYVTGYSLPADSPQVHILPATARSAMLLMLAHLYKNREAVAVDARAVAIEVPLGCRSLLDLTPDRENLGMA